MPRHRDGPGLAGYLFRFLFVLLLVAGGGFLAYATVADLSRPPAPRAVPVSLGDG